MFPNSEPIWKRGDVDDDLQVSEIEGVMLYSGISSITQDLENPSTPSYCKWYNAIKYLYYALYLFHCHAYEQLDLWAEYIIMRWLVRVKLKSTIMHRNRKSIF